MYRQQVNHVIKYLDLFILHRCKNLRKDQTAKLVMSDTVLSLLREQFVIHYCVEPSLLCCVFALSSSELNRANPKNINWIKLSYFYILFIFFFRLCALNIYRGIMRFSLRHRTTTTHSQLLPYFAEMKCKKKILLYKFVAIIHIFNSKLGHCDIQKQWCLQVF